MISCASAAAAIFSDCQTPFQTASMIATSIACSRKSQKLAQPQQRFAGTDRMRTVAADIRQRLRVVTVDLDPEHIQIGDFTQNLQITLGFRVKIQIEQNIHIGTGAVAKRFQMRAQIAQDFTLEIDRRRKRRPETRPPAGNTTVFINKDIGLQRTETFLAYFGTHRFDAVEIGDGRRIILRMIDAPGGTVRPVKPDAVAYFAAEQFVARHAQGFRLGIEQCISSAPSPSATTPPAAGRV